MQFFSSVMIPTSYVPLVLSYCSIWCTFSVSCSLVDILVHYSNCAVRFSLFYISLAASSRLKYQCTRSFFTRCYASWTHALIYWHMHWHLWLVLTNLLSPAFKWILAQAQTSLLHRTIGILLQFHTQTEWCLPYIQSAALQNKTMTDIICFIYTVQYKNIIISTVVCMIRTYCA